MKLVVVVDVFFGAAAEEQPELFVLMTRVIGEEPLQHRMLGRNARAGRLRALAAYKDFLNLWKDADPDIPILKQAKAEYAMLHQSCERIRRRTISVQMKMPALCEGRRALLLKAGFRTDMY